MEKCSVVIPADFGIKNFFNNERKIFNGRIKSRPEDFIVTEIIDQAIIESGSEKKQKRKIESVEISKEKEVALISSIEEFSERIKEAMKSENEERKEDPFRIPLPRLEEREFHYKIVGERFPWPELQIFNH